MEILSAIRGYIEVRYKFSLVDTGKSWVRNNLFDK